MASAFGLDGVREAFRKDFRVGDVGDLASNVVTLSFSEPFPLDLVTPSLRAAMLALVHDENWSEGSGMFERAWRWSHVAIIVVEVATGKLVFFRFHSELFDLPLDNQGKSMKVMYNGLVVGSKAYRGLELSSHVLRVIMDHLRSMSSRLKTNIVVYGTTASPTALHVFHRNWISYAVWPKENGGYSEEAAVIVEALVKAKYPAHVHTRDHPFILRQSTDTQVHPKEMERWRKSAAVNRPQRESMWIKYNIDVPRGDRVLHFTIVTPEIDDHDVTTQNASTLAKL